MTNPTDASLTPDLPDFSKYGFRVKSELGANRAGGRVTYLARHLKTRRLVVIKQFQFAKSSNWVGYDAIRQEGQVLKSLKHRGIPRYLGVFKSDDGLCMVQEYKHAHSLAEPRSFGPDEIRKIAISCLEILVYLQNLIPPVIHRDLKPANILVSKKLKVYLVDFGFARIGDGTIGVSSVVKGTLGFMPPEQIFNRQLTEASDLYGLGMTLICLITNTSADQVGDLVDSDYRVDFTQFKASLSPQWIKWLQKMTHPRPSDRFENASTALESIPDHGLRQPQARFNQSNFDLVARNRGEILTTAINLTNSVPQTTLTGSWHVAPHKNDPASSNNQHSWIKFSPNHFQGNDITTQIRIDTSQLMSGENYERTLMLKSNAHEAVSSFTLAIKTAPTSFTKKNSTPYPLVAVLLIACYVTAWVLAALAPEYGHPNIGNALLVLALFGNGLGWQIAGWLLYEAKLDSPAARITMIMGAIAAALVAPLGLSLNVTATSLLTSAFTIGLGMFGGSLLGLINGLTINRFWRKGFKPKFSIGLSLLTSSLGTTLGLSQGLAISTPWMTLSLIVNTIGIGAMLAYLSIERAQTIALYRRNAEQHLIRP
ncbi:MAG: protein kinase [Leptolyngbya sp. SIO3F4]|nr:protein kinase [Leptolyngbya sp. SIO3F4]